MVERGLLAVGLFLVVTCTFAYIHRFVMFRAEMTSFDVKRLAPATERHEEEEVVGTEKRASAVYQTWNIDHSLWSVRRARLYQASLGKTGEALAVLRIPRLHLEVPLLEGTDEFTLNRGVGRIAGTSLPGQDGNIGIAGYRDGFFRPLKDVHAGDSIELATTSGTLVYAVDRIRIASPADVGVLRPRTKPSLTLVTCYPFYFVGRAPNRYIVEASLRQ
jgi:sortase A